MRGGLLTATGLAALLVAGAGQSQTTAPQQPVSPAQAEVPDQADTETLREALVQTYRTNPTLTGQRAQVRTLDEDVAIAKAQGRPQISATAGVNQDLTRTGGGNGRNFSAGVDVSLPLFQGGRVRNSVRAADVRVLAGRATLRATQGDIFTEAVAARSEEHTSELQSLMRISYAVFCL